MEYDNTSTLPTLSCNYWLDYREDVFDPARHKCLYLSYEVLQEVVEEKK